MIRTCGWRLALLIACMAVSLASARAAPNAAGDERILMMLKTAPDHFRPDYGAAGGYADVTGKAALARVARRIARTHHLVLLDQWPMPLLGIHCFVIAVPAGTPSRAVIDALTREPEVAWSQPLNRFRGQQAPPARPDPLLAAQPAEAFWRLDRLHRLATGRGVMVAVIDSRIDSRHPDLLGQVALARDFTGEGGTAPERHGTNVAGIIAARAGNGMGISGLAPDARLMGLRACWEARNETVCDSLTLARAIQFAIERSVPIINLSLSGPEDPLLARLIEIGLRRGSTIVAAVDRSRAGGGFPASLAGVVAVTDAAVASDRASVYAAPGHDIPTTAPGGRWLLVNGSSFAAAHVSGLAALLRQRGASPKLRFQTLPDHRIDACRSIACAGAVHEADCASPCTLARSP